MSDPTSGQQGQEGQAAGNQQEGGEGQDGHTQPAEVDSSVVRNHKLFKEVTARQKEENKSLKSQLSELQEQIKQRDLDAESAKAAEEGRLKEHYGAQVAELTAKLEALGRERARDAIRGELVTAAVTRGIVSPIVQKGLLAEYEALEGDDVPTPGEWLESLSTSEQHASLFAAKGKPAIGAGHGGRSVQRGTENGSLLKRLEDPTDTAAFEEARSRKARGLPLD